MFSSKVNDLHTWNNCFHVLPNFEYLCLNKFCSCAHVVSPKGSKEWYHNLASPSSLRQNLWTFVSWSKWWAFIQSFEHSKCASAPPSGFPENSGLKFDQLICKCLCPATSWCWGCSCPCLQFGVAAPSSLFSIFLFYTYSIPTLIYCVFFLWTFLFIHPRHNKFTVVYLLLSKFNLFQMLEFDTSWELATALFLSRSEAFPIFWISQFQRLLLLFNFDLLMIWQNFQS